MGKRIKLLGVIQLAWVGLVFSLTFHPAPLAGADRVGLERILPDETLKKPVHLAAVPDGKGWLVVVEQNGIIKWFRPGDRKIRGVLLNLTRQVRTFGNEEGLLSIAFHPNFKTNHFFYVYYSASWPQRSVIARFTANEHFLADPKKGKLVLEVKQPYGNHNGGQLAFGPDGFLYIALGDGGSGGDPKGNGQNRKTLLGAILRIDVDRPQEGKGYGIPADNPMVGMEDGSRPEIWAFGLRNPWRFSFDRKTGFLYAADVGQNKIEEVNRIKKGGNYGWNIMEGSSCYEPPKGCLKSGLILPITEYDHQLGRSITGGFVYRGSALTFLAGRYVFGDFVSGNIWSIPVDAPAPRNPELLLKTDLAISSFGEDAAGEIYLLDWRGGIYRLKAEQ